MATKLWLVAGPNGAGKTTCVQKAPIASLIPDVFFINPDDRTLGKLRAAGYKGFADAPHDTQTRLFIESADEVLAELEAAVARGDSVGVETVLSSDKYRPLVERVIAAGGFVGLIYVALSSPEIARDRVAIRVRRGGHGVPEVKIAERWHRSLGLLTEFAAKVSAFWVLDNSNANPDAPAHVIATGQDGRLSWLSPAAFPAILAALAPLPREPSAENALPHPPQTA